MLNPFTGLAIPRTFHGSARQMQMLVRAAGLTGTWKRRHSAEVFRTEDAPGCQINWWPDTGDVLLQIRAEYSDHAAGDWIDKDIECRPIDSEWTVLPDGELGGWTLPEIFIHHTASFLAAFHSGELFGAEFLGCANEARVIMERARSITLCGVREFIGPVYHQFDPSANYCGFKLRMPKQRIPRSSGTEFVDHFIDFGKLYNLGVREPEPLRLAIRCMMRAYEKKSPYVWDAKGCGRFFNTVENFYEAT
jgi:hypothetical protein